MMSSSPSGLPSAAALPVPAATFAASPAEPALALVLADDEPAPVSRLSGFFPHAVSATGATSSIHTTYFEPVMARRYINSVNLLSSHGHANAASDRWCA